MKDLIFLNEIVPNVVDEVMLYFCAEKGEPLSDALRKKNVTSLIEFLSEKYHFDKYEYIKEFIALCEALCSDTPLVRFYQDGFFGSTNSYYWKGILSDGKYYPELKTLERTRINSKWENATLGFRHIVQKYKRFVIPIVYTDSDNEPSIGTGFVIGRHFLVTARHCLEKSKSIAFGGIDYNVYNGASVYYHKNPFIDIAVVFLKELSEEGFKYEENARVLESVITMGYPKIPGFTCFETVEEATISAMPEKRFTATTGSVAASAQEIWSKENLFLITAKIKGGNSGGPVINRRGACIGVVSAQAIAEGPYDDLGYGTAVPIVFALEIIKNQDMREIDTKIVFEEFMK